MTSDVTLIGIARRLTKIETMLPTVATKADLQALRADLQAARTERKSDLHNLTRWIVIAVLGSVTAAATITGLIVRFVGPAIGG